MDALRKFRLRHPWQAAMIAAVLLVVAGVALAWTLVTNDPLLPSALYGIGNITHLVLWRGDSNAPSTTVQYAAVIAFALTLILCIVVARMFFEEWGRRTNILVTFRPPCGEGFVGGKYQLFGIMCLQNIGNEDFLMLGWSINTEWGTLHHSADEERYQLLKAQLDQYAKTAMVVESTARLSAHASQFSLVTVLLEHEMPSIDTVSPSRKILIIEGQKQQIVYQLEWTPYFMAIQLERDGAI